MNDHISLWGAASSSTPPTSGTQLGTTQSLTAGVTNGLFTVVLNDAGQFGASGVAASVGGILGASVVGYNIGSIIDWTITTLIGKALGDAIYDVLHPKDREPAFDPTKKCR